MAQFLDLTGLTRYKNKSDALYAKQDGSYEGMTVGNAEQLVSTVGVEDNAPYVFRTTGGSADVGDRTNLKSVVGGTVAWNQVAREVTTQNYSIPSNVTIAQSSRTVTLTFTSNGSKIIYDRRRAATPIIPSGHVIFVKLVNVDTSNLTTDYKLGYTLTTEETASTLEMVTNKDYFVTRNSKGSCGASIYFPSAVSGDSFVFDGFQYFDLTQMLGSAIADYVYTLESGTAGAGIAWLKKYGWFTKPYYPYAAANLQSVKTSAHKTIGFNQWDEVWEIGGISSSTGNNDGSTDRIRSKNYIPVFPNVSYYIKSFKTLGLRFYDADKNYLSSISADNQTRTTPNNCYYMRFVCLNTTTYNHDICINLHWDGERDGEYEPYEEHTYALDDVELRGIPKLDANNNLYYDGDTYEADGTVTRKYGTRAYTSGDATDGSTMITDGTTTVYKLTTPTTESADAYTELQICDDFGTEEFVDAATRDFDMPVGNVAVYSPNLRAKLEMAPNSPDGDGDYIVRQTNGVNEYVLFSEVKELPDMPTEDGTYVLKCTVADGTATLSWVSE